MKVVRMFSVSWEDTQFREIGHLSSLHLVNLRENKIRQLHCKHMTWSLNVIYVNFIWEIWGVVLLISLKRDMKIKIIKKGDRGKQLAIFSALDAELKLNFQCKMRYSDVNMIVMWVQSVCSLSKRTLSYCRALSPLIWVCVCMCVCVCVC